MSDLPEQPVQQPVKFTTMVIIAGAAQFRSVQTPQEMTQRLLDIMNTEHRVFCHEDLETQQVTMLAIPPGAVVEIMTVARFETIQNERRIMQMRQQQAMQPQPMVRPLGRG